MSPRRSVLLIASILFALSATACKKDKPAPKPGSATGSASKAPKKPALPVAKKRPRLPPPVSTVPPPDAAKLLALVTEKGKPKPLLLRRPTPLGGKRYIAIFGLLGQPGKDKSRPVTLRATVIEQDAAQQWATKGSIDLPAEGATLAAVDLEGHAKMRRVRAGLRLRDVDGDGKHEAVLRYRYPTNGADDVEGYALVNVDASPPSLAFHTIFARIDPPTNTPKQRTRLSYSTDLEGQTTLRVTQQAGKESMTKLYRWDKASDRFKPVVEGAPVKAPKKSAPAKTKTQP